jgi:fatty-acyl-CoA synthase
MTVAPSASSDRVPSWPRRASSSTCSPASRTSTTSEPHSTCTEGNAANLFGALGVGPDEVVAYVLPNLPETHDAIWGVEAAGIVTAINPFLEPGTIRDLLDAARARVIVTLAPTPGLDLFEKVTAISDDVASLREVLCVDASRCFGVRARPLPAATPGGKPILPFDPLRAEQPADRLSGGRRIRPDDVAALFHTGGTTGTPKLARHTHGNQVFASWVMAGCLGLRAARGAHRLCSSLRTASARRVCSTTSGSS